MIKPAIFDRTAVVNPAGGVVSSRVAAEVAPVDAPELGAIRASAGQVRAALAMGLAHSVRAVWAPTLAAIVTAPRTQELAMRNLL